MSLLGDFLSLIQLASVFRTRKLLCNPPKGYGPIPEVGAIPGRPAAGGEQALTTHQVPKI